MVSNQIIPTAIFGLKDFLNAFGPAETNTDRTPAAALYETEQGYELEVELPGVHKENIDINVENKQLSIKATRKRGETEWNYKRDFRISDEVDQENLKASFEDGLLKLTLNKKAAAVARKVQIF